MLPPLLWSDIAFGSAANSFYSYTDHLSVVYVTRGGCPSKF